MSPSPELNPPSPVDCYSAYDVMEAMFETELDDRTRMVFMEKLAEIARAKRKDAMDSGAVSIAERRLAG